MPSRHKGLRRATRRKLAKPIKERGKIKIKSYLQSFDSGDRVLIKVEPAYQKGMPFRRFFGKQGTIVKKQGSAYLVSVKDGKMQKQVLCAPVHLRKV